MLHPFRVFGIPSQIRPRAKHWSVERAALCARLSPARRHAHHAPPRRARGTPGPPRPVGANASEKNLRHPIGRFSSRCSTSLFGQPRARARGTVLPRLPTDGRLSSSCFSPHTLPDPPGPQARALEASSGELSDPLASSDSDAYEEDFSEYDDDDDDDGDGGGVSDADDDAPRAGLWRRRAPQLAALFARPRGLRSAIRARRRAIGAKGKRAIRQALTGDPTGLTRVRDYVKLPRAIRLADKVSFTLGVVGLLVTQFVATEHPSWFHAYYLATAPLIFSHRAYQYFVIKYHYFLIDFCYYANAAHFWQILCRPRSARFFKTTFAYANGPILWAIPLWRNSLVFHSHDKVQSVYIHCVPAILTWCARWYGQSALSERGFFFTSGPSDDSRDVAAAVASAEASLELFSSETSLGTSFAHFFLYPTLGYLAWQCAYLLKTELWDVKRLDEDPELVTSLRWLANDYKAGVTKFALRVGRATGAFGKDELFDAGSLKTKFVFVTLQLLYTVVTFLPIPLCYRSKTAHTSLMLLAFLSCIWNGAEYYIDIFSRRYARKFEEDVPYGATVRDEDEADAQVDEQMRGSGTKGSETKASGTKASEVPKSPGRRR